MRSAMGALRGGAAPVRCQRGMVTIELAVGILLAALLTAGLIAGITLGATHAATSAAAQQIALHTARGDAPAVEQARREVPSGGTVTVLSDDDGVQVTVNVAPSLPVVGDVTMTAQAWARWEPGVRP